MRTRGEIPGLRLFESAAEEEETVTRPSFWNRIGSLFTLPPLEYEEGEYDDLSGAGWSGGGQVRDDEGDWEDDLAESIIIIVVIVGIMGLLWLRQTWARVEAARVRNAEERRRREMEDMAVGQERDREQQEGLDRGERVGEVRIEPPII